MIGAAVIITSCLPMGDEIGEGFSTATYTIIVNNYSTSAEDTAIGTRRSMIDLAFKLKFVPK